MADINWIDVVTNAANAHHHARLMAAGEYRVIYESDLSNEAIYNLMEATFEHDLSRYELVLTACEAGWTLAKLRERY